MLEFKYLGYVLDESGTDVAERCRKMESGRKVAGAVRSLFNARGLQLDCTGCYMKCCSCLFSCMAVRQ